MTNALPENERVELISMGMDIGMYALAKLFAAANYQWTPQMWDKLAYEIAFRIESTTGVPAEDIALNVSPMVEEAIKKVRGS